MKHDRLFLREQKEKGGGVWGVLTGSWVSMFVEMSSFAVTNLLDTVEDINKKHKLLRIGIGKLPDKGRRPINLLSI